MKTNINTVTYPAKVGSYVGDDSENRAIPHGLARVPKLVVITAVGATSVFHVVGEDYTTLRKDNAAAYIVTQTTTTNFYVGDAGSYANSANANGVSYTWVAL